MPIENMVLVKIKDEALLKRYQPYKYYGRDIAYRGQKEGKWDIVDEKTKKKLLEPNEIRLNNSDNNDDYLKRKSFKSRGLSKYDLLHEK